MEHVANDRIYCRLCRDTGRVHGLDENLEPTLEACVLCHPERLGFDALGGDVADDRFQRKERPR